MSKFKVGDRVTRHKDVYNLKSRLMHGTVIKVYSKTNEFGHYPELYKVQWDKPEDGTSYGFLPHGIDHDS